MPRYTRKRIFAAKIQTDPLAAISLAAADAVFNAFDVQINPTIPFIRRERQAAGAGELPGVVGAYGGSVAVSMYAIGGASAPAMWATLLPACGFKNTAGVFTPLFQSPDDAAADTKRITIGVYKDGKYMQLHNAMGNLVMTWKPGEPILCRFTFMGLWTAPSNVSLITPTYPTTLPPRWAGGLTVGSISPKLAQMEIDLGNQVILREDPSTSPQGYCAAEITQRVIKAKLDPESTLTGSHSSSVWDVWADFLASTERAAAATAGSSGNRIAIAAPKLQIVNPQEGNRNDIEIDQLECQLNPSAAAGNDELTVTID